MPGTTGARSAAIWLLALAVPKCEAYKQPERVQIVWLHSFQVSCTRNRMQPQPMRLADQLDEGWARPNLD